MAGMEQLEIHSKVMLGSLHIDANANTWPLVISCALGQCICRTHNIVEYTTT